MRGMRTRLTDILEVEHPVMLAGMGGVSYHRLVAAVSEAGGFGCLGASTMGARADGRRDRRGARRSPTKPFGVDLLTAAPRRHGGQGQRHHRRRRARCSSPGSACRATSSTSATSRNVLVVNMCGKVRHAIAAVEAGCDIVVAQGTEAGGHTGQVATMALVPQIVDAVGDRVPVVAAGGIFDGRGLAAALALGADGVWVGTRFIATPEARSVPGYKDALLRTARGRHRRHPGLHRQDLPGDRATPTRRPSRTHGGELRAVPRRRSCSRWRTAPTTSAATRPTPGRRSRPRVLPGRPGRRRHRRARARGRAGRTASCEEAEAALARAGGYRVTADLSPTTAPRQQGRRDRGAPRPGQPARQPIAIERGARTPAPTKTDRTRHPPSSRRPRPPQRRSSVVGRSADVQVGLAGRQPKIGACSTSRVDMGTFVDPITFTLRDRRPQGARSSPGPHAHPRHRRVNLFLGRATCCSPTRWTATSCVGTGRRVAPILGPVWRIVIASIIAMVVSELIDTEVYHRFVTRVTTRYQWARGARQQRGQPADRQPDLRGGRFAALPFLTNVSGAAPWDVVWDIFWVNPWVKGPERALDAADLRHARPEPDDDAQLAQVLTFSTMVSTVGRRWATGVTLRMVTPLSL